VPLISSFFGIAIRMYFFDAEQHHLPHVHAEYQGRKAQFDISTGDVWQARYQGRRPAWRRRGSKSTRPSWVLPGNLQ
jgi:hypothetical protein